MPSQVISSEFVDSFIVSQGKGQDSTIQVFEEVYKDWPRDKKALRFVSDQSLASQSDRAWNVEKAIKDYAHPKGYDTTRYTLREKNEWVVYYDANFHSHMEEWKLREQVKASPSYKVRVADNLIAKDAINRKFGVPIAQLKNLIFLLEKKNREELDELNTALIDTQLEILAGLEIPETLNEEDKKSLFAPHYPLEKMEMDHYTNYGQGYAAQGNGKLPTNLEEILGLLEF